MNLFRFIKKRNFKNLVYLGLFFIILIGGFLLVYKNRTTLVNNKLVYNQYTRSLLPAFHAASDFFYKLPNLVYLPLMRTDVAIPEYQIIIDNDNLEFLNENLPPTIFIAGVPAGYGELTDQYKKRVEAKFIHNGREYEVEVRYRGDHFSHWVEAKKSWQVIFDKDDLFNGVKVLKLIIPSSRDYLAEYLNSYRAAKLGLTLTKADFATLAVNSTSYGVYYQFEDWSKEFLEKNELSVEANLYVTDDDVLNLDDLNAAFTDSVFWKKKTEDEKFSFENYSEVDFLINAINQDNFSEIVPDIIDLDNFYNWQILSMLAGSQHQNDRGNSRLYFNNTSGKFEFIPWDIKITDSVGSQIVDNILITRILSDPIREFERNQLLWEYVSSPNNLTDDLDAYDDKYNQLKPAFYANWNKFHNNFRFNKEVSAIRKMYLNNFNNLVDLFQQDNSQVEVFFNPKKLLITIDITVDNFSGLNLDSLTLPAGFFGQVELFYDADLDGILSSGDKLLGRQFVAGASGGEFNHLDQYIHSQRIYNPETLISQLESMRHSFFVRLDHQPEPDFDSQDIILQLSNAITGEEVNLYN